MMCYKFSMKISTLLQTISFSDYLLFSNNFGAIFYVILNLKLFGNARRLSLYVHNSGSVEQLDSGIEHNYIIPGTSHHPRISYHTLQIRRLDPPYDTKCGHYSKESSQIDTIVKKVQQETVRIFNKSTPAAHIYSPINTTLLSFSNLHSNDIDREIYRKIVSRSKQGMPNSCYYETTIPKVYSVVHKYFGATVMWPDGFSIKISSHAKLVLLDYLVYVSSSIGLWYGLSACDIFKAFGNLLLVKHGNMSESSNERKSFTRSESKRIKLLERRMKLLHRSHLLMDTRLKRR